MNIVKWSNRVALLTVVLLFYWIFIFICIKVFDFKVFRENITELFYFSILGIFSILVGAVVLNVMFNLTEIATRKDTEKVPFFEKNRKFLIPSFFISLFIIFSFLYIGDFLTAQKKKNYFIGSAQALIEEQKDIIEQLGNYSFTHAYINASRNNIKLLSKIDESFPQITIIKEDSYKSKPLLLCFSEYSQHPYSATKDKKELSKVDYILSTSSQEREYLYAVFEGKEKEYKFSANDGRYEIYYPVLTEKGIIVIHLSQYSRYGKIGS